MATFDLVLFRSFNRITDTNTYLIAAYIGSIQPLYKRLTHDMMFPEIYGLDTRYIAQTAQEFVHEESESLRRCNQQSEHRTQFVGLKVERMINLCARVCAYIHIHTTCVHTCAYMIMIYVCKNWAVHKTQNVKMKGE